MGLGFRICRRSGGLSLACRLVGVALGGHPRFGCNYLQVARPRSAAPYKRNPAVLPDHEIPGFARALIGSIMRNSINLKGHQQ